MTQFTIHHILSQTGREYLLSLYALRRLKIIEPYLGPTYVVFFGKIQILAVRISSQFTPILRSEDVVFPKFNRAALMSM